MTKRPSSGGREQSNNFIWRYLKTTINSEFSSTKKTSTFPSFNQGIVYLISKIQLTWTLNAAGNKKRKQAQRLYDHDPATNKLLSQNDTNEI